MSNANKQNFRPAFSQGLPVNSQLQQRAIQADPNQSSVANGFPRATGQRRQGDELAPASVVASSRPLTRFVQTGHLFNKVAVEGGYSVAHGQCCNEGCTARADDETMTLRCGGAPEVIYAKGEKYILAPKDKENVNEQ